jgi:hypothetical protein
MTDPKALINDALRVARMAGGPTYYDQLLGKAGGDAKSDMTPNNAMIGNVAGGMPPAQAAMMAAAQTGPDGGGGGGDGTAGGLGDTAGGGGYGSDAGNADSAGGSPAGDGGGTMGMARGGKADKIHPARKIPGFHIRSEEMGQPVFFYGDR